MRKSNIAATKACAQDPDILGTQLTLWSPEPPAAATTVAVEEIERQDLVTKEPLFLHDVPIASEENIQTFEVELNDIGGTTRHELRRGKVTLRAAPHPHHVLLGGSVMRRDDLTRKEDRAAARPIMVEMVATIFYGGGVVQPFHQDVMYVLLHRLYEQWKSTGSTSNRVTISKVEIADILNVQINGRLREEMETALKTLQGLTVAKIFREPKAGEPGHGTVGETVQCMGGIITYYEIKRAAGGGSSKGGRRPDILEVDINSAIVRAMCGMSAEKPWLVRSLNFTKTLKITSPWKRAFYRMLDARFDWSGHFQMPLMELWVGCLGRNADDIRHPAKWRKARFTIMEALREFEQTGYIVNLQSFFKRRSLRNQVDDPKANRSISINVASPHFNASVMLDAPYEIDDQQEWVYCEPGPSFYADRPQRVRDFAVDIARATTEDSRQAERLVKDLGSDVIVDTAYGRLKKIVQLLGDRRERLSIAQWLSWNYPTPNRVHQVRISADERERRIRTARRGDLFVTPDTPHAERRQRFVFARLEADLASDKTDLIAMDLAGQVPEKDRGKEALACYRLALDRLFEERGVSPDLRSEERWQIDPSLELEFRKLADEARETAIVSAAMLLWFKRVEHSVVAERLPSGKEPLSRSLSLEVARSFPEAMAITMEMARSDRSPWERHLAEIFRRRVAEQYLEELELDRLDPGGRRRS